MRVAALYIDSKRGPYPHLEGVDCWDAERDATLYDGPWPVVTHPPCAQWGVMRHLANQNEETKALGIRAVEQVRAWGGVLEQPQGSKLWDACAMPRPGELPDAYGGWSIEVEQVSWGHQARKRTWLYFVGISPAEVMPLVRTGGEPTHWVSGTYTPGKKGTVPDGIRVINKRIQHLTPPDFATWLVELASRCKPQGAKE